ncbi:MarR family transcriptional regulator [Marinobacterium sp. D7]|uniref:MarR family winged helix-turn-helix transcriptional regulator n=1 Tax=Marinobacterium ramblicola TaxID=2849041 RepID=UPI001C2CF70C|nr:MarR family transcriptional regulator [Marinobacterium ramblicola]MBV1789681.1 MarR family transcriptional regulator [Marinobacterium ramblicola]
MAVVTDEQRKQEVAEIDFGTLHELTGYWLRSAQINTYRNVRHFFFDEFEMTPGLFGVLEIVDRNPGLTQTLVANAMGNDRSAMVAIIDRLEKRGLIERRPSPVDRRSKALYMTAQGKTFQAQVRERALEHNRDFFAVLSPQEHRQFVDMLKRLAANSGESRVQNE